MLLAGMIPTPVTAAFHLFFLGYFFRTRKQWSSRIYYLTVFTAILAGLNVLVLALIIMTTLVSTVPLALAVTIVDSLLMIAGMLFIIQDTR